MRGRIEQRLDALEQRVPAMPVRITIQFGRNGGGLFDVQTDGSPANRIVLVPVQRNEKEGEHA